MIVSEEEQYLIAAAYGTEIHHILENDKDAATAIDHAAQTVIDWAKEMEGQQSIDVERFNEIGFAIRDKVFEIRESFGYSNEAIIYILQQAINFKKLAVLAQEE